MDSITDAELLCQEANGGSFPVPGGDFSDAIGLLTRSSEKVDNILRCFGINDQHITDAVVKDVVHLFVGDIPMFLEEAEDWGSLPRSRVDDGLAGTGQYTGNIVMESATGDMGHSGDAELPDGLEDRLHINTGGLQQLLPRTAAALRDEPSSRPSTTASR